MKAVLERTPSYFMGFFSLMQWNLLGGDESELTDIFNDDMAREDANYFKVSATVSGEEKRSI